MGIKTYSIFGAGASGLYTAWRLLNGEPNDAIIATGNGSAKDTGGSGSHGKDAKSDAKADGGHADGGHSGNGKTAAAAGHGGSETNDKGIKSAAATSGPTGGSTTGRQGSAPANQLLASGDVLRLYDWGQYNFGAENPGTRAAGARVCTWHYKNDKSKSYLEVGGMRYSKWDGTEEGGGHRLVTTVIDRLGMNKYSVPFNESTNPLFYLRTKNMYLDGITSTNPAPYAVNNYGNTDSPDTGFGTVEGIAVTATTGPQTRTEWCEFYRNGRINVDMPESSIYKKGDLLKDIGYWNLMFDQLGSEGYAYTAAGNGYTSNVINWNSAVAFQSNNEFTPGTEYCTLTTGYSGMFDSLFNAIMALAKMKGVTFEYHPNTRLHSILQIDGVIRYTTAKRETPNKKAGEQTTDAAWLAMPRAAIDRVAQATRYETHAGLDVLNHPKVQLYLESAIMQPSYKVGMFFSEPWWTDDVRNPPPYPAQVGSYEITDAVLTTLSGEGFPPTYIEKIRKNKAIMETPFAKSADFLKAVQFCLQERFTIPQEEMLLAAALRNTIGPSVTDTPIRQVVYFGDNANDKTGEKVYGLLAAYDDEMFTSFWQELELGPNAERKIPISENTQTLDGPRDAPEGMVKMLRAQLAAVHFGPASDYSMVPEPLECKYMDWSLPPFNAGYHAYAAHYDVGDVQQKIRKPSQLIKGADANIFIVGEAYSNDQAWVEGAYCTAESVLNDFFAVKPIINPTNYPFICPPATATTSNTQSATVKEMKPMGAKEKAGSEPSRVL